MARPGPKEAPIGNEDEARKQAEEDAKEDLELRDENADKIAGGGGGEYDTNPGFKRSL